MAREKSKKPRRPRARAPRRDPADAVFEEIAVEMLEVISCPVMVADDQARRVAELGLDAEQTRDLAMLAARLHPDAPVAPVLAELAQTVDRHARELAALADRLFALTNHDVPHAHNEPSEDDIKELLVTMFGDPRPEAAE